MLDKLLEVKLLSQNFGEYEIFVKYLQIPFQMQHTNFHFHQQCLKETVSFGNLFNGQRLGHINFWDTDILKFNLIFLKYFLALFPCMCKPTVY